MQDLIGRKQIDEGFINLIVADHPVRDGNFHDADQ